jgi:hypothetical protein
VPFQGVAFGVIGGLLAHFTWMGASLVAISEWGAIVLGKTRSDDARKSRSRNLACTLLIIAALIDGYTVLPQFLRGDYGERVSLFYHPYIKIGLLVVGCLLLIASMCCALFYKGRGRWILRLGTVGLVAINLLGLFVVFYTMQELWMKSALR